MDARVLLKAVSVETRAISMAIRDLRNDRGGGIEGLPLQLMIIILVATMGTAIIVGWMGSIETPHSIGDVTVDDGEVIGTSGTIDSLTITVRDQDGNYLEGATVVLQGMNVKMTVEDEDGIRQSTAYSTTDSSGKAVFKDLTIDPSGTSSVGFLYVTVSKAGYGEDSSTRVTVIL